MEETIFCAGFVSIVSSKGVM